jgi:hypothetical protein
MKKTHLAVATTALISAAALAVPAEASAAPAPDVIGTGFAGPLQIDLGSKNQIYVAQDFAGIVTKLRPNGTTKDIVTEQGEVAGVASRGYSVAYTFIGGNESNPVALLKQRRPDGTIRTIADLGEFEAENNPDASQEYGFRNLSAACAAQVPPEIGGEPYNGIVESHPYAVANAPDGGWYVADAAANDVLHIAPNGDIDVFGVLRPRKTGVTAEAAEALGLPDCTIGEVYAFEAVPTDVEVKDTGALIVSLLPGGPEDDTLGARGAVIRLAGDGEFANLASGFEGATNVALRPGGKIYVTELFGGQVSVLQNGVVTPVRDLVDPAAIEFGRGKLFASTDVFGAGNVVSFNP